MSDLATRILNAIPAAAYEMNALVSLLRIDETTAVRTASVSCERRPVLRVNPEFVRAHCRTDEHLFMLVMHELHHVLLGHTRLFPRATRAHNLAFDAVINAMLVGRFPAEAYTSFFLDLYGAEEGALRLLAPPGRPPIPDRGLARLHRLLYEESGVSAEEVFEAISRHVGASPVAPAGAVLLGNHGGDGQDDWGTAGPLDKDVVEAIRGIVEKWPPPEQPITGRSLADLLKSQRVDGRAPGAGAYGVLRQALVGAARRKFAGGSAGLRQLRVQDVIPVASDRRASVMRTAGREPLLFLRESISPGPRSGRAQVYLDVSGSMDPFMAALYGALRALRQHVEPNVQLFSTVVCAVSLDDLHHGTRQTTGGTDLACVIDDIIKRKVRKALIITDGYVGAPTREQRNALDAARCEIRVVLTPRGWRSDLEPIAVRMDVLPEDLCQTR